MSRTFRSIVFKRFLVAAGGGAVILLMVAAYYWYAAIQFGELGRKDFYSFLQEVELKNRGVDPNRGPILLDKTSVSEFSVLGLKSSDTKFPRTWIILDRTAPDGSVLKLPTDTTAQVSCDYVEGLRAKKSYDVKVLQFLGSICTK
jgi:hypothetical protein